MRRSGVSVQTGSGLVASPVSANAWHRQPPKSIAFRGQVRQGSCIQASPRNAWKAGDSSQIQRSGAIPNAVEAQRRDVCRAVTGQRPAVRHHHQVVSAPPAVARLRIRLVVIGQHVQDLHAPAIPARSPRRPRRRRHPPDAASASAPAGSRAPSRSTACSPARGGRRRAQAASSMISPTRSMLARCRTTLMEKAKPSDRTMAAAASFCGTALMPAIRSATRWSESWIEIWMCSSPASRSFAARRSVSPTPDVTSVVYSPSVRACAASSSTSGRTSGSPPDRPSCSTPSSRASVNDALPVVGRQLFAGADSSRAGSSSTGSAAGTDA